MAEAHLDRRMLAILAADVVGYARLMESDEAGTIGRLRATRTEVADPLIAEHKGRIVKLMGDGALLAFDSVVDAVACGVDIQQALAARNAAVPEAERIVFRIGINLGDVALVDGDVYGDGVNIAARVEQLCEPGGVAVSGTAYDHLHGKLALPVEFMGEHTVKSLSRPVRVYRVAILGAEGASRRPALPLPDDPSIAVLPFENTAVIRRKAISPTESSRRLQRHSLGSPACSSSPETPASSIEAGRWRSARSAASWACAIFWRAASARRPIGSGSRPS